MVTNSPNCTSKHRAGYTCLQLGKAWEECCHACQEAGSRNLLSNLIESEGQHAEEQEVWDTPHDHTEYVEGCFRCDLSRHEAPLLSKEAEQYAEEHPDAAAVASFDLPAGKFPFDIVFVNKGDKQPYHEIHVTGPGVVEIPPGKQYNVKESEVYVRFADGTVVKSA